MLNLGFLAEDPAEEPPEDRVSPVFPLLGLAGGGYLGWRLDGAPGMAMGAAAGGVAGVILDSHEELLLSHDQLSSLRLRRRFSLPLSGQGYRLDLEKLFLRCQRFEKRIRTSKAGTSLGVTYCTCRLCTTKQKQ
jgi:hypothetical protein